MRCKYKNCYKQSKKRDVYCYSHRNKSTITRFLDYKYSSMKRRVSGKSTNRPDLYSGKAIVPKDAFMVWAKNNPDFLSLYKRWVSCNFDRKLTPTINRINSSRGYTLDNMEWMTNSQNCGLSAGVKKLKAKKEIYNLLGVNNNV